VSGLWQLTVLVFAIRKVKVLHHRALAGPLCAAELAKGPKLVSAAIHCALTNNWLLRFMLINCLAFTPVNLLLSGNSLYIIPIESFVLPTRLQYILLGTSLKYGFSVSILF
jgi:hypothetical protein